MDLTLTHTHAHPFHYHFGIVKLSQNHKWSAQSSRTNRSFDIVAVNSPLRGFSVTRPVTTVTVVGNLLMLTLNSHEKWAFHWLLMDTCMSDDPLFVTHASASGVVFGSLTSAGTATS